MREVAGGVVGLSPQKLTFSLENEWPRIKMGCKRSPYGCGAPNLHSSPQHSQNPGTSPGKVTDQGHLPV